MTLSDNLNTATFMIFHDENLGLIFATFSEKKVPGDFA